MKIYAMDKDQLGLLLVDKNVAHAIRHYNPEEKIVTIFLNKIAVKISMDEIAKLSMHGVTA